MVIIPAFNEEEYIGETLDGLLQRISSHQILVIDDGSQDRTAEVAQKRDVLLHRLPFNKGKGGALEEGLKLVRGEVILFLDADLGYSSRYVFPLIKPISKGEVEATIGILPPPKRRGGFGIVRSVAERGVRLLRNCHVQGTLSGQRAFKQEIIEHLLPFAPGFGLEVGLTLDMLRAGISFLPVEVNLYHRESLNDWPGFYHRGIQLLHIFRALIMKG